MNTLQSAVKALARRLGVSIEYRTGLKVFPRGPFEPPSWCAPVGPGDYVATGDEFLALFQKLGGLKPTDRVLDVGCGTGRMARPLTSFLTTGTYDGLDIIAGSIQWCRRTYARKNRRFHFYHVDVYNKAYNPLGTLASTDYRFPVSDASIDFVFLTSVFTHMLPADVEHYLDEIARVLAPGGRCLMTSFLINDESRPRLPTVESTYRFTVSLPGCYTSNAEVPEGAIAYDESRMRAFIQARPFTIVEPIHGGYWCGRDGATLQDVIVVRRT